MKKKKKKKEMKSCIYLTLLYLWGRKRAAACLVWWQKVEQEISVGEMVKLEIPFWGLLLVGLITYWNKSPKGILDSLSLGD